MVWQVYQKVSIPIIGMGGITTANDAIEFIMAGAAAVAVGTGNFRDPLTPKKILAGMEAYLVEEKFEDFSKITGIAQQGF
jgi:dihydroorotate dehydrogenase (NAD+) catalytic subunit